MTPTWNELRLRDKIAAVVVTVVATSAMLAAFAWLLDRAFLRFDEYVWSLGA